VLQAAGIDISKYGGKLGEGKVATFAQLPDDVKSQALDAFNEQKSTVVMAAGA